MSWVQMIAAIAISVGISTAIAKLWIMVSINSVFKSIKEVYALIDDVVKKLPDIVKANIGKG